MVATRSDKAASVEALAAYLKESPFSVVAGYTALRVGDMQRLRRQFRESGVTLRVVKNSLARLAAQGAGLDDLVGYFNGQSAIAFGTEDIPAPARVLRDFARRFPTVEIRGGVLDGSVIDQERVLRIADLPGRDDLRAQLVWTLDGPISGLVHTLDRLISGIVYALQERVDQLQASA